MKLIAYATFHESVLIGSVNIRQCSDKHSLKQIRKILDKADRKYRRNVNSNFIGGFYPTCYVVARELPLFSEEDPPWLFEAAKRWLTLGEQRQITPVKIWASAIWHGPDKQEYTVRALTYWSGNLCPFMSKEEAQQITNEINIANDYPEYTV